MSNIYCLWVRAISEFAAREARETVTNIYFLWVRAISEFAVREARETVSKIYRGGTLARARPWGGVP